MPACQTLKGDAMERVYAFLADGFETVEALAVVDVLRRANVAVDTVSIMGRYDVNSAQNVTVKADKLIEEIDFAAGTMIFLPGGLPGTTNLAGCEVLEKNIIAYDDAGKRIAAICAAPSILGDLGLLKGRAATCYPGFEARLTGATAGGRVVTDGNITTGVGMGAAVEFGLELVRLLKGEDVSKRVHDAIIAP